MSAPDVVGFEIVNEDGTLDGPPVRLTEQEATEFLVQLLRRLPRAIVGRALMRHAMTCEL